MAIERTLHLGAVQLLVMSSSPVGVAAPQGSFALWRNQAAGSTVIYEKRGPTNADWAVIGGGGAGPAGPPGSTWYSGAGAPAGGTGIDGDFYLNTTNGDVYTKAAGAWGVIENLVGPAGAAGAAGPAGPAGPAPAGTGYVHVTGGALDAAVASIPQADIAGLVAALAAKVDAATFNNHHARHENGGADQVNVGGLSGVLANPQPPIIGATGTTAVAGNDARLTDARTPTAHGLDSAAGFHTASGLTVGWVLRATGASTFAMAALQAGDIPNIAESQVTNLTTDLAGKAPTTRSIATTAPLTGGGDLSADRTLAVSDATTAAKGVVQLATSAQITAGLAVQASDTRLSDARTPTAHKTSHQSGGSDEINVGGLLGVLANPQPPIIGTTSTTAIAGNDSRVLNAEQTTNKNAANGYAGVDAAARVNAAQSRSPALRASANVALSASATINITALDLAVKNGDVWILDYFIPVTVSGGVVGLKPIFTGVTSTLAGTMECQGNTTAVTATTYARSTTPTTALATAFITASFTGFIWVRAMITVSGADGSIRFGLATGASAAGNILAGATLMATKV